APQEDFAHCLTHCDYGPHNVLVADNRIAAILDWETGRIGDPAEDIGCFLQSCGTTIAEHRILGWYRDITGNWISEYRLRYYDVVSCLKVLMVCLVAESLYEHSPQAPMMFCQAPLLIGGMTTGRVEQKIALAEAVRGR